MLIMRSINVGNLCIKILILFLYFLVKYDPNREKDADNLLQNTYKISTRTKKKTMKSGSRKAELKRC